MVVDEVKLVGKSRVANSDSAFHARIVQERTETSSSYQISGIREIYPSKL